MGRYLFGAKRKIVPSHRLTDELPKRSGLVAKRLRPGCRLIAVGLVHEDSPKTFGFLPSGERIKNHYEK